ncbi:hypothetical protein OUZ56_032655 [Daphnia magna]|uniref:Tyr recombinase domain-containing protein n=1 Tax=Daphnia magna TaxID=35525 RepID=A0ABR0B9I6_9CRUS|nr:hypothetical protein OUZ56_032655 [Daphnia magna]
MNFRKLAAAMRAGAGALHLAAEAIDDKGAATDDEGAPPSDALAKRRADDFLTQNGRRPRQSVTPPSSAPRGRAAPAGRRVRRSVAQNAGPRWRRPRRRERDLALEPARGDGPDRKASLAYVKQRDVEGLSVRLVAKGLSVPPVIAVVQVLRGAFHEAVRDGKARINPCLGAKMPKDRRTQEVATVLRPEQQSALLRALDDHHRPLVAFALGTGLRAGELAALRREDVHADEERPFVYVRFGGAPHAPPKNGKARVVALFGMALEAARIALATRTKNPHGLLFSGDARRLPVKDAYASVGRVDICKKSSRP